MTNKLIRMLKQAHAIEIGAYHAYEGHWKSLNKSGFERLNVWWIQQEEEGHRECVSQMLEKLNAKSSPILDSVFWVIGKTISAGCSVFGYRMAMFGAKVMETLGAVCYKKLAEEARKCGFPAMTVELERMQKAEERHEEFFKKCLNPSDPKQKVESGQ